jgi:hypothetical protein
MDKQISRAVPAAAVAMDPVAFWQAWGRSASRAPLSGNVMQAFHTSLLQAAGDQLGFININTNAGDPQLEQRITNQVASYGRQLGWIIDALDVLIRNRQPSTLTPHDTSALNQLKALRGDVEAAKGCDARERIDRVVADIRTLKQDPEAKQRLREALDGD